MSTALDRLNIQRFERRSPGIYGIQLTEENLGDLASIVGPATPVHAVDDASDHPAASVLTKVGLTFHTNVGAVTAFVGEWVLLEGFQPPLFAGVITDELLARDFIHVHTVNDPAQERVDVNV